MKVEIFLIVLCIVAIGEAAGSPPVEPLALATPWKATIPVADLAVGRKGLEPPYHRDFHGVSPTSPHLPHPHPP